MKVRKSEGARGWLGDGKNLVIADFGFLKSSEGELGDWEK